MENEVIRKRLVNACRILVEKGIDKAIVGEPTVIFI